MIFVSAVVPVYNSKSTLRRAVKSLLIQKEIDEIFLVDDGSLDGSFELCKELESEYSIIKMLYHPKRVNKGAPASRNLGLFATKNKWIQFLDSDDQCLKDKISKQLKLINEKTSLVIGQYMYKKDGYLSKISVMKDVWSGLISTRLGITSANLWNAEIMKNVGGWNEELLNVQEYFMMFEILKVNDNVAFLTEPLCKVYHRPESISNSDQFQTEKRDNYFFFRNQVMAYLSQENKLNLNRFHFYTISTGNMLRYHTPPFEVEINNLYFKVYRKARSIFQLFKNRILPKDSKQTN